MAGLQGEWIQTDDAMKRTRWRGLGGVVGERGDIILSGLLRTVLGLLFIALIVFEVGAVAVNQIQLDRAAQLAAREAERAYGGARDEIAAERAADAATQTLDGAVLLDFAADAAGVSVTLARPAPVLLADQIPLLRDQLQGTATARARPGL